MKIEGIRSLALSLPDVTEEPHFDKVSFRVGGKIFATIPPEGTHVHVFIGEVGAQSLSDMDPSTFEKLMWGRRLMGVRVALASVDPDLVQDLLEEAWRLKASKRAGKKLDSNRQGR